MPRLIVLTVLAMFALAAPAAGAKKSRWSVEVKGKGTFHHVSEEQVDAGVSRTVSDLRFGWTTKMPTFVVRGRNVVKRGFGTVRWRNVKATRTHEVPQPSGTETGSCTGSRAVGGGAVLDEDRSLLAPVTDAVGAGLVPFNILSAPMECTGPRIHDAVIALTNVDEPYPLDIPFELPFEALRQGKIIQLFDHRPKTCPVPDDEHTQECSVQLEGTITFRRRGR